MRCGPSSFLLLLALLCGCAPKTNQQPIEYQEPSLTMVPVDPEEAAPTAVHSLDQEWIIELSALPSLSAVKPGPASTPLVQALRQQQDVFLQALGDFRRTRPAGQAGNGPVEVTRRYYHTLNGVSAVLTSKEVEFVSTHPQVSRLTRIRPVEARLPQSVPQTGAGALHSAMPPATGKGVVVALVDTGIAYLHPALGSGFGPGFRVLGGKDFVNHDDDPMDDHGHGTQMAGIVGAAGAGLTGMAPECRFMAFKVLDRKAAGLDADVISALEHAADPNQDGDTSDAVQVVNLSLSGAGTSEDPLCRAVDQLCAAGIICVCSAGNSGKKQRMESPASATLAITVGSADRADALSTFNTWGPAVVSGVPKPDLCAPGEKILTTHLSGKTTVTGTSPAAAHVSGAVALLRQQFPAWSPTQIKSALSLYAAPMTGGGPLGTGGGRLDVLAASQAVILAEPAVLDFGRVDGTTGLWRKTFALKLTCTGAAATTVRFESDASQTPPGTTFTLPPEVTLPPGTDTTVIVEAQVDLAACPLIQAWPRCHTGSLRLVTSARTSPLNYSFLREPVDAFEPNNTAAEASAVVITERRTLLGADGLTRVDPTQPGAAIPDEDWFRFDAQKGEVLFFYADTAAYGSPLMPWMEVVGPDGKSLQSSSLVGDDARIVDCKIRQNGAHLLRLKGQRSTDRGEYRLFAHKLPAGTVTLPRPVAPNPVNFVSFYDQGKRVAWSQAWSCLSAVEVTAPQKPLFSPFLGGFGRYGLAEISVGIGGGGSSRPLMLDCQAYPFQRHSAVFPVIATASAGTTLLSAWVCHYAQDWIELDATAGWQTVAASSPPGRRRGVSMIWDEKRDELLFFGGSEVRRSYINDTWTCSGGTWKQHTLATFPKPRAQANLAWDSQRERVVLYGGYSIEQAGNFNDTWEWDGATWQEIKTPTKPPFACFIGAKMAYDSQQKRCLLATAADTAPWQLQLWAYDGHDWSLLPCPTRVMPGNSWTFGYDQDRAQPILLNCLENDQTQTWTHDGADWHLLTTARSLPIASNSAQIVYDKTQRRLTIVAVDKITTNVALSNVVVWTWDGTDWQPAPLPASPRVRTDFGLAWNARSGRVMLYGGSFPQFGTDSMVDVVDGVTGTSHATLPYEPPHVLIGLAANPKGGFVTAVPGKIHVHDGKGAVLRTFAVSEPQSPCRITEDGTLLQCSSTLRYKDSVIYRLADGSEAFRTHGDFRHHRLAPDGTRVIHVVNWQIHSTHADASGNEIEDWRFNPGADRRVFLADTSADGSRVAAAGGVFSPSGDFVQLAAWTLDAATGRLLCECVIPQHPDCRTLQAIVDLAIAPNGSMAAFATWGADRSAGEVIVFNATSSTPLLHHDAPGSARTLALSNDHLLIGTKGCHATIGQGFGDAWLVPLQALPPAPSRQ